MTSKTKESACLPAAFSDLQRFADAGWDAPERTMRRDKRLASPMSELQEVYDMLVPRLSAMVKTLEDVPIDAISPENGRLLNLMLALADMRNAVESYGEPALPEAFDSQKFHLETLF